jgi:hypothetical protein
MQAITISYEEESSASIYVFLGNNPALSREKKAKTINIQKSQTLEMLYFEHIIN